MPRSRCQLRMCDPQIFLLLPLLARPHRHAPILQTQPVDTSTLSVHESKLAPRAVSISIEPPPDARGAASLSASISTANLFSMIFRYPPTPTLFPYTTHFQFLRVGVDVDRG